MKKHSCVFTITYQESFFLPLWCKYYSKFFDEKDMYIMGDEFADDSIIKVKEKYPNINIVNIKHPNSVVSDDRWLLEIITRQWHILLDIYDVVVFADTDEFFVCRYGKQFSEFITEFSNSSALDVRARGIEVIHNRLIELDVKRIDGEKLLEFRNHYVPYVQYCKTIISKHHIKWCMGFHYTLDENGNEIKTKFINENLILLHLHKFDCSLSLERILRRHTFKLATGDVYRFEGYNKLTTLDKVQREYITFMNRFGHHDAKYYDIEHVDDLILC